MSQEARSAAQGREFDLGDVLSVTTGKLLSLRHMDGIYDALNHMTGDSLMTHQLPRACDACQEPLLEQHPDLRDIEIPKIDGPGALLEWLPTAKAKYGETRRVVPLAEWEHRDPIEEACDLVGAEKVSVFPEADDADADA